MKLLRFFTLCGFIISIMTAAIPLFAQQGTITLLTFGGYTFEDQIDFSNGYGKVGDGFQWGAGIEIGISPVNAVEVYYQRLDTKGYIVPIFDDVETADIGVNYIMFGGTRYVPINDVISGFGSMDVGLGVLSVKDRDDLSNVTKFAWGIRGGLRIAPSERASLRIHAQLLSPVQAAGGGFYFGTGGSGVGVSTYSSIYQFNLGGSINIRIR